MRKNYSTFLGLIAFITMLLSSCGTPIFKQTSFSPSGSMPLASQSNNNCIPPISNIGVIPIGVEIPKQVVKQIPPVGWEPVGSLPESAYIYSFAVQNENEIWVSYSDPADQLMSYRTDNGEKKFYSASDNSINLPAGLFFSRDGTLWSTNYTGQNTAPGVSILSRYDKSTDQFVYVLDELNILQSPRELGSRIIEDKSGLFWMFLKDPETNDILSLYSFNPTSLMIEKHPLQVATHFANLEIATNSESIWTLDQPKGELIQYVPSTREIHPFDSLPSRGPDEPPISLTDVLKQPLLVYYDDSERIWLDNKGWLDFTDPVHPGYYKLIPSPMFIGYFEAPQPQYGWLTTFDIFESSNGLVWFTTNGGVIRLDIRQGYKKGEWCLITNGYSRVEEDNQKNLWMIVFDKIYKYHLKP